VKEGVKSQKSGSDIGVLYACNGGREKRPDLKVKREIGKRVTRKRWYLPIAAVSEADLQLTLY